MIAENRKLAASTMNERSRPNFIVTTPPIAAPTASIVPHVDPISTLAGPSSSGVTMFGSAACDAGSKYAEPIEMTITPAYANGSSAGVRASNGRRHAPVRATSTMIINLRRSTLSTICPAIGVKKKSVADPVSESTRSSNATVRNQSPPSEISVPT